MAVADVLILGPIIFTDFGVPERMPFGGRQAMAVHKLLGGRRAIDTLGPDDHDIYWRGTFYGNDAYSTCLALDALRAQGQPMPLSFAGQSFVVVIAEFRADIERLPQLIEYSITCVISQNGGQGVLGAIGFGAGSLLSGDLTSAIALAAAS